MYCEQCGARIGDQARFCGQCGAAVLLGPPAAPALAWPTAVQAPASPLAPPQPGSPITPASAPSQERPLSAIPLARLRRGLLGLGSFNCTLVITTERILVAAFTAEMQQQQARKAAEQAQGMGWRERTLAVWQTHGGDAGRYLQLSPQAILAESSGNFAIPRAAVRSLRLVDPSLGRSTDDLRATTTHCELHINAADQNYLFEVPAALQKTLSQSLVQAGWIAG